MSLSESLGEVHEIKLDQGTISYRERGAGRPIVFVHGFLVNADLWSKVVPLLGDGFRCIAPDWPIGSHSKAMNADAELAPPDVAQLVGDFLERMDLEDVVLVANDSGGAITQMLITSRPERVGAVVLTPCDAFEKFPPPPFNMLPKIARTPVARELLVQSMRVPPIRYASFRPLLKRGYDKAIVKSWTQPMLKDHGVRRDTLKFAAGGYPSQTLDAGAKLGDFDKPVLLAWSPDCTFYKWELAERLQRALPNARLEPVPDGWTFLALDQPERLAELIGEFAAA